MNEELKAPANNYREYLFAAVYICGLTIVLIWAVRIGLSHYFTMRDGRTSSGANLAYALFFDPNDPEAYINRGDNAFARLEFPTAAENYQRAVEVRKNDFVIWLRLGVALEKIEDVHGAEAAYLKALELAPNFAQPNRAMGLLLVKKGDEDKGFAYLRTAAIANSALYSELLKLALAHHPSDPDAIERVAEPQTPGEKKMLIAFMINHNLVTDGVKQRLIGNELSDEEKDLFINQLLEQNKTQIAYDIWATKSGVVSLLPPENEKIFDGGFENITGSDNSGFGWRLQQKLTGTAVSVDTSRTHSGARSLSIQFKGNLERGSKIISQLVPVRPNTTYRLSFAALSNELLSGALPVVKVAGGNTPLAASSAIQATGGKWVVMNVDLRSGEEDSVLIALERGNCQSNPCPIFGDLFLDEFSLVQTGPK
jgi:tetratricopeptide (TPR) repeat protein